MHADALVNVFHDCLCTAIFTGFLLDGVVDVYVSHSFNRFFCSHFLCITTLSLYRSLQASTLFQNTQIQECGGQLVSQPSEKGTSHFFCYQNIIPSFNYIDFPIPIASLNRETDIDI